MSRDPGPRWDDDTAYGDVHGGGGTSGGGGHWGSPQTSEFAQVPPPAYGAPPPRQGMSAGLAVLLTLMAVTIIGLIGAVGYLVVVPRLTGGSAAPETSTVVATETATAEREVSPAEPVAPAQAPRVSRPSGAYECADTGGGQYSRVAVGSSVTSCEFAVAVRSSYLSSGGSGGSMVVRAYSPVTGRTYTMSCSGGSVVTCTGGNNAVVHIY